MNDCSACCGLDDAANHIATCYVTIRLRDRFAIAALAGIAARNEYSHGAIAQEAYLIADAMLLERGRG